MWDGVEAAAQKRDISGTEGDWPPSKVRGLCRDRHFAKFIARVSFATAIFAAAGASEAAKDDSIADATCFRERERASSDREEMCDDLWRER